MKIENKQDDFGLFSSTDIPDVFFSEYLSIVDGVQIKVYLYILFLSKYNKDININEIAKFLSLSYEDVNNAIKFWEDQGILIKKIDGYLMVNLREIQLNKLYSPKVTSSPDDIEKVEKSKARAAAIESINNQIFSGVMSPNWYTDIDLWFEKYGFDEQVMLALFCQCAGNNVLNRNYIQTVAENWHKEKIKTYEDLEKYFERQDTLNKFGKEITSKLGIRRSITEFEKEYILKWINEYNYNMDIIEMALKRSVLKANAGFKYYDELLTDWHQKGLSTPSEVDNYLSSLSEKKTRVKQVQKIADQFEFTQSTFEGFENLYDN